MVIVRYGPRTNRLDFGSNPDSQIFNGFLIKIFGGVGQAQRTIPLVFGGDPDHSLDPEILLKDSLFTIAIPTDSLE